MSYQEKQLSGKVIAVTGAGSGIGMTFAKMAVARGASVSLADVSQAGLDKTVAAILAADATAAERVQSFAVDVRNAEQVQQWIDQTVARLGRLDGAANMAGVIPKDIGVHTTAEMDVEQWQFVMDVNTTGLMHCLRAQLAVLADGGSIVNASSIAGVSGRARNGAYAASKHAVIGLSRSACKEYGPRGVRVNCVCPGSIDTPMNDKAREIVAGHAGHAQVPAPSTEGSVLSTTAENALGRKGRPEEVAHLVAYLLSDESTYVSGTAICVDGGWMC